MDENKDVLGTALKSFYFDKDRSKLWVLSEMTEKDEMPIKHFFRDFENMPEIEKIALKKCNGKVLDIGSGAGSHTLWLQKQMIDVTAVDHSKGCIEVMIKRGVKRVVERDIYDPIAIGFKEDHYDTVLLLMNGIGIAESLDKLSAFLNLLKDLLSENGQILFDSSDLKYLYLEDDGSLMIDLNGPYYGEMKFRYEYKNEKGPWFKWLYIDEQLMEDFAKKAQLKMEVLYRGDNSDYLARLTRMD